MLDKFKEAHLMGETPCQSSRSKDSLVAHHEDHVGAAGPLQPIEGYDVDYTNGGLFYNRNPLLQPGWGQGEEIIAMLNPKTRAKRTIGGDCDGFFINFL